MSLQHEPEGESIEQLEERVDNLQARAEKLRQSSNRCLISTDVFDPEYRNVQAELAKAKRKLAARQREEA